MSLTEALQVLTGERLSAVTFLKDYLQLDFDGHVISAYALTDVRDEDGTITADDPGFRDALCARIGWEVAGAEVGAERVLVRFEDGGEVGVSLRQQDRYGTDALSFESFSSDAVHVA
ncbi:hypothetical protein [Caulobacter sp. 17J65-9]|uniref:hypothetical protein n=1 Tax=Caulobacter sp. 17J65-9 TaxID=2709382 RepID=UPI0013C878AD|nr:hypothetical protein [Caulobacter sp. 17J65-9]NEX91357.1 hypothetical protein [Caulobacter sp. 17J65-9]